MTQQDFPESDWKIFREVREAALERFCKQVLDELPRFRSTPDQSFHKRYLALFGWLGERNEVLARAFDDPRRSQMLWQLAVIHSHGLLEPNEIDRFTLQTRERIQTLAKNMR